MWKARLSLLQHASTVTGPPLTTSLDSAKLLLLNHLQEPIHLDTACACGNLRLLMLKTQVEKPTSEETRTFNHIVPEGVNHVMYSMSTNLQCASKVSTCAQGIQTQASVRDQGKFTNTAAQSRQQTPKNTRNQQ